MAGTIPADSANVFETPAQQHDRLMKTAELKRAFIRRREVSLPISAVHSRNGMHDFEIVFEYAEGK